jgi:transketolase N-terminal domain/subunit
MNTLQKRCVDISYRHKLTHVSSVLNTVNVIAEIYANRAKDDPFVLGNSHASLALFVVLERYGYCDAEEMVKRHGTHACRDMEHGVWVSGGSLGQAETVAVGMALAEREHHVNLVTSDGACMEGSVWEAMRIADKESLSNLKVDVVFNGLSAYDEVRELDVLSAMHFRATLHAEYWKLPIWMQGLKGHYLTLTEEQYASLMV